jgi:hypothetical protein
VRRFLFLFVLLAACSRSAVPLEGNYHSTWGACVVLQATDDIAITYSRGSMRCAKSGESLSCEWVSGSARGRAKLTRQRDNSLSGTWGHDGSDSDGGAWVMIPET